MSQSRRACPGSLKTKIFILHGSHHLTDYNFHGDGLVAWGFINELARRGHRVHVLTDRLDVRAMLPPNLTLAEFPWGTDSPIVHYVRYLREARAYYARLVADEGVDIVHQMNPVIRGLSLALIGKNVPIVLGTYVGDWAHLPDSPDYHAPSFGTRVRLGLKWLLDTLQPLFATSLVLATPHAAQRIPFPRFFAKRIEHLHHGVDADLFSPIAEPDDPLSQGQTILYLGSLNSQKGAMDLIEAFARIAVRFPASRLTFVGDGPMLGAMQARLHSLGLSPRARFTGRASRREVAGWLRSSAFLCAPSYGEPYGQNVLEAMATAKPVIITTEGGHRYLSDADGKLEFRPGDIDTLADAMATLLSDPARCASMGAANRALIERQHAWPRAVDGLEAIYERAIAKHAKVGHS